VGKALLAHKADNLTPISIVRNLRFFMKMTREKLLLPDPSTDRNTNASRQCVQRSVKELSSDTLTQHH
jgi:hypothetical protein